MYTHAMLRRLSVLSLVVVAWGCGIPTILPPRTPPTQQMPPVQVPAAPPLPGQGRVVIEATDGPMDVAVAPQQRFTGGTAVPMASGPLCRTPCVADIPFGSYNLYFSGLRSDSGRGDMAPLNVGEGMTVMRRAPGLYRTPPYIQVSPILLGLGSIVLFTAGGVLVGATPDEPTAGSVLIVGGVAMLIGAFVTAQYNAEQQDGTSTIWTQPIAPANPQPATITPPMNNPTPVEVTP